MSKKRRRKISPQTLIRTGLILLAVVAVIFVVKELINKKIENEDKNLPESSQEEVKEKKEEKPEKEPGKTEEKTEEKPEEKEHHKNYEGNDPNENNDLTGTITTARVTDGNLIIRIEIDQFLASGKCELTLTKNEKTYSETANIFADASTSTCEGFNIPISSLESGNWTIKLKLVSNEKTGKIEGEVNI